MDTLNNFTITAQDIHNKHFEQKINKDQEIAERRINEYFDGKLNLSWKTILREINKLNELTRNKYFEMLTADTYNKAIKQEKEIYMSYIQDFIDTINKLKKANWILSTALIIQTCVVIYLKWGLNV